MDYYRGLLHQKGHGGLGTLLKIGGSLAAGALGPVIGEFLGGLVRKKQTGKGVVSDALKQGFNVSKSAILQGGPVGAALKQGLLVGKNTILADLRSQSSQKLKNLALPLVETQLRQNLPFLRAPIIGPFLDRKLVPMVKNKVASAIDAKINKIMANQQGKGRRRRRRKQRGKGVVGDLLKGGLKQVPKLLKKGSQVLVKLGIKKGIQNGIQKGAKEIVKEGTRQAIQSAAQAGIDALEGKKLKEAGISRAIEGIQKVEKKLETKLPSPVILAKGGPRKRKRTIKVGSGKKARLMDIFD